MDLKNSLLISKFQNAMQSVNSTHLNSLYSLNQVFIFLTMR